MHPINQDNSRSHLPVFQGFINNIFDSRAQGTLSSSNNLTRFEEPIEEMTSANPSNAPIEGLAPDSEASATRSPLEPNQIQASLRVVSSDYPPNSPMGALPEKRKNNEGEDYSINSNFKRFRDNKEENTTKIDYTPYLLREYQQFLKLPSHMCENHANGIVALFNEYHQGDLLQCQSVRLDNTILFRATLDSGILSKAAFYNCCRNDQAEKLDLLIYKTSLSPDTTDPKKREMISEGLSVAVRYDLPNIVDLLVGISTKAELEESIEEASSAENYDMMSKLSKEIDNRSN